MSSPRSILMISKPVAPPWNDSSKNLVKDLALAGRDFSYRVLTPEDEPLLGSGIENEAIYPNVGEHTPALRQNLKVLRRLLRKDSSSLTHFFFAPNPKTSATARATLFVRPRLTVQTICSAPKSFDQIQRLLFAQRLITLSRHTRGLLIGAGIESSRIHTIAPGIQMPVRPQQQERLALRRHFDLPENHRVVIFPGDYQFSSAAQTVADATPLLMTQPTTVVFACRIKQEASRLIEKEIDGKLRQMGVRSSVKMLNQVDDILNLLAACDICVLPAESLYAKMDIPLVLIEALALGLPIVVADLPPLNEVLVADVGRAIEPKNPQALARAVDELTALDPAAQAELSARCVDAARTHFDIGTVSRQHEALYSEILETLSLPKRIGR